MTEQRQTGMDDSAGQPTTGQPATGQPGPARSATEPAEPDHAGKPMPAWRQKWQAVPTPVRKSVVFTIGLTLLAIGGVLVILPGPFTLPFVIAGIAILSSEFVWAAQLMRHGQKAAIKAKYYLGRVPKAVLGAVIAFVVTGIAASVYWVLT